MNLIGVETQFTLKILAILLIISFQEIDLDTFRSIEYLAHNKQKTFIIYFVAYLESLLLVFLSVEVQNLTSEEISDPY